MLTWYYDTSRTPLSELFDTLKTLDDLDVPKKRDTISSSDIKIEMPGVKPSDLDVTIQGKTLKVKGKSRHGKEFSHTYSLHSSVDESGVTATLQDGLLEISLPKKPEVATRKINVTS